MARRATLVVLGVAIAASAAAAVIAQTSTVMLEQLERKYPRMKAVHIEKCDRDGDGLFTKPEQVCVASIYRTMYINDH